MNVSSEKSSNSPEEKEVDLEEFKYHLKSAVKKGFNVERRPDKELDELLTMIQLIDNILSSNMTLSKQQNLDYCKSQRYLMKLYMKKIIKKTSS